MKWNIAILCALFWSGSPALKSQSLEHYLQLAADHNALLKAKYKGFEVALQKIPQVSSLPDPIFSFGYFVSPVETKVGPQRARFSVKQMLPWSGMLKAAGDAATLLAKAKYEAFLNSRNHLFYEVAASYYPLCKWAEMIQLEHENVKILKTYKHLTIKQLEHGNATIIDGLRVDMRLKEATTNLQILREQRRSLLAHFNALLNRAEETEVTVPGGLETVTPPNNYHKDSLLREHPILREIDLKLKASQKIKQLAIKKTFPKLGVGLDYTIVGNGSDRTLNGRDILVPTVSMSIPIFRKKYNAAVQEAQLMQTRYQLQHSSSAHKLTARYASATFELSKQRLLIELYEQQMDASQQALDVLYTAYVQSGKAFEEALHMQEKWLKYAKMKANARMHYQIALAKFNYITSKSYLR